MKDGEKIVELMKARKMTQNGFARETKVAQSYISYIVNGKKDLTEGIKKKICTNLGIDISYFDDNQELEDNTNTKIENDETKKDYNKAENILSGQNLKDYGDILQIAIEMQKYRNQLLELIKKERENVKYYGGIDQDFLHKIENIEELSDEEAIEILLKEKHSRKDRRVCKNRIWILQSLMDKILHNPYQFVLEGINATKNFNYKKKIENEEE